MCPDRYNPIFCWCGCAGPPWARILDPYLYWTGPRRANTMHRSTVNKRSSAKHFNKKARLTHPKNVSVMRGGYRL